MSDLFDLLLEIDPSSIFDINRYKTRHDNIPNIIKEKYNLTHLLCNLNTHVLKIIRISTYVFRYFHQYTDSRGFTYFWVEKDENHEDMVLEISKMKFQNYIKYENYHDHRENIIGCETCKKG